MDLEKTAKIFKAFCDPNRIMILELIKNNEKCGCELQETLDIPQSTLAHHMKVLCDSGVVKGRKDGKWTHYSIDENNAVDVLKTISNLIGNTQEY